MDDHIEKVLDRQKAKEVGGVELKPEAETEGHGEAAAPQLAMKGTEL